MLANRHYPSDLGARLRIAREAAALTQAAAASKINVARTTLVAIEQGVRPIRTAELHQLTRAYGVSLNRLLRHEAVFVELAPQFRKLTKSRDRAREDAAKRLESLVRAEVELENLLGVRRRFSYPPERPIMRGDLIEQANQAAAELRHWLGLGSAPVQDVIALLELDIGVRLYVRQLDASISGLFAFDREFGACMLLNSRHRITRRNQTAAHELGHFISSRSKPIVMRANTNSNSREERYANLFGRAFLTPSIAVMQHFGEITAGASHLTRRHVIVLAHRFGVSREAMVRRLEELGLTKRGTWDWFVAHGGITDVMEQSVLGELVSDRTSDAGQRPVTFRLQLLAAEAWRQDLLSEGQLAQLLQINRIELRILIDEITNEEIADEALELP